MASILIWTLLLIAGSICNSNAASSRIIGGSVATVGIYPSIVQVESRTGLVWSQMCGANIVSTRYTLSAASCFSGLLSGTGSRRIRAGATTRGTGGTVVSIARIVNHPSYSSSTHEADISLVELATPLTFNSVIQPIAIVSSGYRLPDGLPVVHAGWGATRKYGLSSSVLRAVQTTSISRTECAAKYWSVFKPFVSINMICSASDNGSDFCEGDFGGPLYYDGILVGIMSWKDKCSGNRPGVSTNIASYTDWIIENAK